MIGTRWQNKPPVGYQIDFEHPLAAGLVSFWAFNEGSGAPNDIASTIGMRPITLAGGGDSTWTAGNRGPVYNTDYGGTPRSSLAFGNCPDLAINSGLFSIAWGGTTLATGSGVPCILDLYDATSTDELLFYVNSTAGDVYLQVNSSGADSATGFIDGNRHAFGLTLGSTATNGVTLYRDGRTWGSLTVPSKLTLPPTTQGWLFNRHGSYIGYEGLLIQAEFFGLWYRPLAASEHAAIAANPWQIFQPRRTTTAIYLGTPDFTITPSSIPTSRPAGVALTLVGQASMNWASGTTTMTPSGIAGDTLSGLTITSTTQATVTAVTGATAGTLTLTDNNGNKGTVQVVTPVITPTPASLPADHAGQMTIDLASNVGVWTAGSTTTFSIAGVTGVTLVSQSVASPTSASIVVTTGTGSGPLAISDGFETATVQVTVPTLAVTLPQAAASVTATGTYTITLTGTNTVWSQETLSPLFSVAGGTGATLTNIHVLSNTSATATLDAGTAPGTLTITDNSVNTTATITVAAPPSGSLHITGPLLLEQTGGATGAFGNQNAAALAFEFRADSNAGINLAAGTTVVDWGSRPAGGYPLAAFCPAVTGGTSVMNFSLYGAGGTTEWFRATVPIELGTGYHFLLSWETAAAASVTANTVSGSSYIGVTAGTLEVGDAVSGAGIPSGTMILAALGGGVYQLGAFSVAVNATATATGVALTVQRGTQTLYVNGLPCATGNYPYLTYAYQQIQIGGNAGTNGAGAAVATDHQVANLAIWEGGLTASDAAGLAAGTLNPLNTSTPASAWWALGGGTAGATPSLSDGGLTDLTLNGNTLSLAATTPAGSLANAPYAAPVAITEPVIVAAMVPKCGKLAVFGTSLAPTIGGAHLLAPLAAVNGTPTVLRNGTAVALNGPLTSLGDPNYSNVALAVYRLDCGGLDRIGIASGGSGYIAPSASVSGGGGTGAVLGTPTIASGVVSYDVIAGGSGFKNSPHVAIVDQGGTGLGATAIALVNASGQVAQVNITAGGTGYTNPAIFIAAGYNEVLTPTVATGAITSIAVTNGGTNYPSGTLAVAIADATGSGAIAYATAAGGSIASITVLDGGSGYSNSPTIVVYQPGASLLSAQAMAVAAVAGGVVTGSEMTNNGSGYGVPPEVVLDPPPNWQGASGGLTATPCVHVAGGAIDALYPMAGGMLGCGSGYSAAAPPSVYVGGGSPSVQPSSAAVPPTTINLATNARAVASVTINAGGKNYSTSPTVTLSGGGMVGTPTVTATVTGGVITAITVTGSATFTSAPTVTITDSTGSGAAATAVLAGTAIASVTVPNVWGAAGFGGSTQIVFTDPTGSGAIGTATLSGGQLTAVTIGGSPVGGSNYTAPSMTFTSGSSSSPIAIRPVVANYLSAVPVTTAGSGYTSTPTIAVTDPAGTGAVFQPLMTGVLATDTMTYSAPASWLSPTDGGYVTGGVQAVSGAAMANWTGQFEGATGGLWPIAVTPTMVAGADVGGAPVYNQGDWGTYANKLHQTGPTTNGSPWTFQSGSGTITLASNGITPVSWTPASNIVGLQFYNVIGSNMVDQMGKALHIGQWTVQYDDPDVNTIDASAVWLNSYFVKVATATPVPQSGPTSPVVMSQADITITGGVITAIGTANTALGSGYQAAGVVITNPDGSLSGAAAVAVVSGGAVTSFEVIAGGAGWGTGNLPVVTVYGTRLAGNRVTAIFDIQYVSNPFQWRFDPRFCVAQRSGLYNIANPWVNAPDSSNGNLAVPAFDSSDPYLVTADVLKFLTAPSGKTPGLLRWMDVTASTGGESNYIDPADLNVVEGDGTTWGLANAISPIFAYARYFNTDPTQTQYRDATGASYSSPKLYGTQAPFVSGVDASFTNYGGVTSSGTPYLALPPDEAGTFLGGYGHMMAVELRSMQPHGLKTGQEVLAMLSCYLTVEVTAGGAGYTSAPTVTITGGSGTYTSATATIAGGVVTGITVLGSCGYATTDTLTVSLSGGGFTTAATATATPTDVFSIPSSGGMFWPSFIGTSNQVSYNNYIAWVTGPDTILVAQYVGGYSLTPVHSVLSEVEIPVSIKLTRVVPNGTGAVPYKFAAASSQQLGNTAYWCNLPPMGTDALWQDIAANRVAPYIGPTAPVYLEYGNENWNGQFTSSTWQNAMGILLSYIPVGTPALTYFTGNGVQQSVTQSLNAAHGFQVFENAWTGAGMAASRLKRLYGSFWAQPTFTGQVLQTVQQWGAPNADYVVIAPYTTMPTTPSIVRCFSPAGSWGSSTGGAGSWPLDAINDAVRLFNAYNQNYQSVWQGHQIACQTFGQPLTSIVTNGNCAAATATLTATTIAAVGITQPGANYTSVPEVILLGGGGTYTSATATLGPVVTVTNGGSNYSATPSVSASGGGGTYTAVYATVVGGVITAINFIGATGYTTAPTIAITDSTGTGATATATLGVSAITVAGSAGYTMAPSVLIQGGGPGAGTASAVAALTPTTLASATVTIPGSNYTIAPQVVFSDGTGGAAVATVVSGYVASVAVTNPGFPYSTPPVVSITDSTGTGATAIAVIGGDYLLQIVVTNPGSGYSPTPTVNLTVGSGATATASIANGALTGVTITGGGSGYAGAPAIALYGGGSLPPGEYYTYCTFLDAQGRETTVGMSQSGPFSVAGTTGYGSTVNAFGMPPWPTWAASMNVYLTQPNGAPGSQTLYMNIPASQYGTGHAYPINAPVGLGSGTWLNVAQAPPTTNLAAANLTQPLPRVVGYEGGFTSPIPTTVPFAHLIMHDSFAHPSCRDAVWSWFSMCQTGCPSYGAGAAMVSYFSLYNSFDYPYFFLLAYGDIQSPGAGTSNRFATLQGGPDGDGHDHNAGTAPNQATALQGFIDWYGATATVPVSPTPTPTSTRRWFPGLRRPVMRPGS